MRGASLAVLFALSTILAGCIADEAPPEVTDEEVVIKDDGKIQVRDIKVDPAWVPTLETPPQWRLGQWWKYRMTDVFTGEEHIFYRVVAGQENETGSYLVGMPTHGFSNAVMVLHIPGFGQIDRNTLGYELHDCMLEPLHFPVKDGDNWKSEFECGDVIITAAVVSDTVAEFTMTPDPDGNGGRTGTYTYDATLGEISRFTVDDYASYEIIETGYDFHLVPGWEGNVTVPYAHDVIFMHGRIGNALAISPGPAGNPTGFKIATGPTDTVTVPEGYDRVSFAIILGDALGLVTGGQANGMGQYSELAIAPDGAEYYNEHLGEGIQAWAYKNDAPVGTWTFDHLTVGPGIAMSEGIAYSVFDIQLPWGDRINNVKEHEHENGQGH